MAKSNSISALVYTTVFSNAFLAYIMLTVGYVRSGLALIIVFVLCAYAAGAFKRVREWPLISKISLACTPLIIAIGCYLSTQKFNLTMAVPGLIYAAISFAGGMALRRLD